MRGYFGVGVEGISKALNLGNLIRSAHAFGARFFFTIGVTSPELEAISDTAQSPGHMPIYRFATAADLVLPEGCKLVGVELLDDAIRLPSFPHPVTSAYVLGPERGRLSDGLLARCDHLVAIPTAFSINVGVAGAIVMYDRLLTLGRHATRPLNPRASATPLSPHVYGEQRRRRGSTPRD
jgi:tRNA G18 (ribose-2'-O)-methylase SpoU